jgi:hypothetical protein
MFVNILGEHYEFRDDNSVVYLGETLIHGIYADLPDEQYIFIPSECIDDFEVVTSLVEADGIPVVELRRYDPEEEPFRFIINALCRYFSREVDNLDEE